MKVALIHYRLVRKGGLETRLLNYIDWFARNGHSVTVICAKRDHKIKLPDNVGVMFVKLGVMPKKFRLWYFNRKLKKIMANHYFDFSLSLGRTNHQDAVIVPGNHLGYLFSIKSKFNGFIDLVNIKMDCAAYRDSKIIYAASNMMKHELIELYNVPEEKIFVLFPPINIEKFDKSVKPSRQQLRKKFGMIDGKFYFAFVSASHNKKGLPLLLKVFEQLHDEPFELIIAGVGKHQYQQPNIHNLGYLVDPSDLFIAADCTIHPSIYEPFGQVIAESLQCGTPAIVSHMVGAKEIVSEKEGIIVDSFNPDDWLKTIRSFPYKQFNIDPQFSISQELTLDHHMEKMLRIWNNTISKNDSGQFPLTN